MKVKLKVYAIRRNLLLGLVAFFVILSKSFAGSTLCEGLFSGNPVERRSQNILRDLFDVQNQFYSFLIEHENKELPPYELQQWIQKVEHATLNYFDHAGIAYQEIPGQIAKINLGPGIEGTIQYSTYQLLWSRGQDKMGKFLAGVFTNPRLARFKIIYDPMLEVWYSDSSAGFLMPDDKTLVVTYSSFTDRAFGVGDHLRHELAHAFEDEKVARGKESLASFEVSSTDDKTDGFLYARRMRLDEIEGYLRDIRYLKNIAPKHDHEIDDVEILEEVREHRRNEYHFAVNIINGALKRANFVLDELVTRLTKESRGSFSIEDNKKAIFGVLRNKYYDTLAFRAPLPDQEVHKDNPVTRYFRVRNFILQRVQWAQRRIFEVQVELHKLDPNKFPAPRPLLGRSK